MAATVVNYVRNRGAGGKFVIILPRGEKSDGIVVFSDFSQDSQHASIVRRWNLTCSPLSGYIVAGGGWWKWQAPDTLVLYGGSAAYGCYNPRWLKTHLAPGDVFTESAIVVEE